MSIRSKLFLLLALLHALKNGLYSYQQKVELNLELSLGSALPQASSQTLQDGDRKTKTTPALPGREVELRTLGLFHLEIEVFAKSLLSFLPGCLLEA